MFISQRYFQTAWQKCNTTPARKPATGARQAADFYTENLSKILALGTPQRASTEQTQLKDISIPSNPSKNSLKSTGLGAAGASVSNFCWNHDSKGVHTGKLGVNYHF
jgi:hypothetical protein